MTAFPDGSSPSETARFERVLATWYRRARESQFTNYKKIATSYSAQARRLGAASVVLSAITGTTLFATLASQTSTAIRLTLGIVSILAAVLTALHTTLAYSDRASQYRATGAQYGSIRREIERYQAFPPTSRDGIEGILQDCPAGWTKSRETRRRCQKKSCGERPNRT